MVVAGKAGWEGQVAVARVVGMMVGCLVARARMVALVDWAAAAAGWVVAAVEDEPAAGKEAAGKGSVAAATQRPRGQAAPPSD